MLLRLGPKVHVGWGDTLAVKELHKTAQGYASPHRFMASNQLLPKKDATIFTGPEVQESRASSARDLC